MKILKKNQIIIYVLTFILMTVGYLNYSSNQENYENSVETSMKIESKDDMQLADIGDATLVSSDDIVSESNDENIKETNSTAPNEYFAKARLERDTMYSQMLESYEKILNSSNAIDTQKQIVTQEVSKINEIKNSIMICENLIKTKGFENNIIFVNGDSISVIVEAQEIKQEEVAQIQNIISREMKADVGNIHISTK